MERYGSGGSEFASLDSEGIEVHQITKHTSSDAHVVMAVDLGESVVRIFLLV